MYSKNQHKRKKKKRNLQNLSVRFIKVKCIGYVWLVWSYRIKFEETKEQLKYLIGVLLIFFEVDQWSRHGDIHFLMLVISWSWLNFDCSYTMPGNRISSSMCTYIHCMRYWTKSHCLEIQLFSHPSRPGQPAITYRQSI